MTQKNNINSLQMLRGLAALAVVFHHSVRSLTINNNNINIQPPWIINNHSIMDIGSAGVDIFFILSGFIMIYISSSYEKIENPAKKFFINRLQRVWPIYSLITLFLCAINITFFIRTNNLPFDLQPHRLASFLFIPSFDESGSLQPILGVGWTLNYEMFFYLIFSISLIFTKKHITFLTSALITISYLLSFTYTDGSVAKAFFGNSIIFEFCFGMIIGTIYTKKKTLKLNNTASISIVFLGIVVLYLSSLYHFDSDLRFLHKGIASTLIFLGFLLFKKDVSYSNFFVRLGNASYSIYLIHIVFIYKFALKALNITPEIITQNVTPDILSLIFCSSSIFVGVLFYKFVEKPIIFYFKKSYMMKKQKT